MQGKFPLAALLRGHYKWKDFFFFFWEPHPWHMEASIQAELNRIYSFWLTP